MYGYMLAEAVGGMDKGFEAYEKYGFAGLFVVVFLALVAVMLYERMKFTGLTEKAIKALEQNAVASASMREELDSVKQAVYQQAEKVNDLSTYMRARDQFIGRRDR